jgi:hypothetical protein
MSAHRAHVGPPNVDSGRHLFRNTCRAGSEKNCSVERSWAIQQPSQRLLSEPKSFSHNQDPEQKYVLATSRPEGVGWLVMMLKRQYSGGQASSVQALGQELAVALG